ncbi:MAG: hypothetical protein SV062_10070, partial [Thermodesulfobacteriota bacterium]|nr:hypothetical protein [Thermodesulfobacteriota bacterium]
MERKVTPFFIFIIGIFFSYTVMAKGESYNPDEVGLDTALKEGCESCHKGIEEVNKKMVKENVNCVICHFGNPIGTTKSEAHNGMITNPGDFRVIERTCGQCHQEKSKFPINPVTSNEEIDHVPRTLNSIMATSAGEIAATRFMWGAQTTKNALFGTRANAKLKALPRASNSPVDNFLRNNCLSCHLWTEGKEMAGHYRSGGCSACHVIYGNDGFSHSKDKTIPKDEAGHPALHEITIKVPTEQCLHCHNGGEGRIIGFGYTGKIPNYSKQNGLGDQQQLYGVNTIHVKEDIHFQRGMDCIDCHSSKDVHGDGKIYDRMSSAVAVRCETCHGNTDAYPTLKDERGEKLKNLNFQDDDVYLTTKIEGKKLNVPVLRRMKQNDSLPVAMQIPAHMDTIKGRTQLECYACHARTATQYYGSYARCDLRQKSPIDWGEGTGEGAVLQSSPGKWESHPFYIRWEEPILGINGKGKVSPFIPGSQVFYTQIDSDGTITNKNRIFSPDIKKYPSGFSTNPIQPHTITKKARSCESCHNN